MAMLYAKTTFNKDDCSKLRDILLDPRVKSKIESVTPEFASEWRKIAEVFFEELRGATSITIEADHTDILETLGHAR